MHKLVVCTAKYFPVTREGGVRNDEVARRIAISISYFGVVDTQLVSRRGLGAHKSATRPKMPDIVARNNIIPQPQIHRRRIHRG